MPTVDETRTHAALQGMARESRRQTQALQLFAARLESFSRRERELLMTAVTLAAEGLDSDAEAELRAEYDALASKLYRGGVS